METHYIRYSHYPIDYVRTFDATTDHDPYLKIAENAAIALTSGVRLQATSGDIRLWCESYW